VTASTTLPISAAGARRRRPSHLQRAVLDWYDMHGRRLAFRASTDPWAVLVAEVMAQQTQVSRVELAWTSFIDRFPTPSALAAATPADALRAWAGLGYNRRAVALHRASRLIVERHAGRVPDDVAALGALPGVGPYTARAVLAIAFGRRVGAVDVNVRRVLTRLESATARPIPPRAIQARADAIVPASRPADWTHALMDLGAVLCRPASPRCGECPAQPSCRFGRARRRRPERTTPANRSPVPFDQTSRWLRGRIIRGLADAPDGRWQLVDGPIGSHDGVAVRNALRALQADGLVELDADGRRARLLSRPATAE
jgi:A/G-specific adenine glycosylase